jgi:UDP-N-acetyl-D-glucosamine dehydrogenase
MSITKSEWLDKDKHGLATFLKENNGKKIVVVQGLGFVGAVMSLVVANSEDVDYAVITVDIPSDMSIQKIDKYNTGEFPIIASDPKIQEYYNNAYTKKSIIATCCNDAYAHADVVIVDINLDVKKDSNTEGQLENYGVDLAPFKSAIRTIGTNCKEDVLVLVETTVPPGTTQKVVRPVLEEELTKRGLCTSELMLAHSYERVMPGPDYIDSIKNFYRVYSGVDSKSEKAAESFLRSVISTEEYPLTKLGNTTATEMAKVLENSYRAMNIAFMVEWSRFAEEAGVNIWEVVNAIRMRPTHKNIMLPGIGVGGYCLTKDPLLANWAFENLFGGGSALTKSVASVNTNDQMPLYAYGFWKERIEPKINKGSRVLLMGVSYRSDVGDTRYSPVERFNNFLISDGYKVQLHDPYVTHWEELNKDVDYNSPELEGIDFNAYDVIVFTTLHREYRDSHNLISTLSTLENKIVYDCVGVLNEESINSINKQNNVKVLGRGDL